ncbi:uncharacterized protein LOC118390757 isoform X2 [Oncorhynchus keta]|uniref:uncharacterized protein LOC118390757 isoform X2 n=1 Tax=Oncorhynchus keta TaxID=8018 RepID=UPI00227BFAAA|nr:uncharacterized protein LOC118390757 isoform X2 [Oncorhynchus keta]
MYYLLRTRKLVTELEPKVGELSRIFHLVLCDCLDKAEGDKDMRVRGRPLKSETQQVLSSITFQICINPMWSRTAGQGNTGQEGWSKDEEEREEAALEVNRRSRSMPEKPGLRGRHNIVKVNLVPSN